MKDIIYLIGTAMISISIASYFSCTELGFLIFGSFLVLGILPIKLDW